MATTTTLALLHAPSGATGSTGTLLRLPCPGSAPQHYILMSDLILETHWYKAAHSSWFVDNNVVSGVLICFASTSTPHAPADGGLHMMTPVDPLFFVLQHLWTAVRGCYCDGDTWLLLWTSTAIDKHCY